MKPPSALAAFPVMTMLLASPALAARFEIVADDPANLVRFESKATMESFEGKTSRVQGIIEVDPAALGDSVTVMIEVDLASLDTGIELRNRHMRENHLETDRYPKAVFRGGRVLRASAGGLTVGQPVRFDLAGELSLHGAARATTVPVEVVRASDGTLHVDAVFPVKLSAHAISRPKFLVLKLADEQKVRVRLMAVPKG
jgi:polyisoprenoid-binding protein YceI